MFSSSKFYHIKAILLLVVFIQITQFNVIFGYVSQESISFPLRLEFSFIQVIILESIALGKPMSLDTMQMHLQRDFFVEDRIHSNPTYSLNNKIGWVGRDLYKSSYQEQGHLSLY